MKIAVLSDTTYRACLPDDPDCLSFYGSESYHCYLARELLRMGHEVHWYAPVGSTDFKEYPNAVFHPLQLTFGRAMLYETIDGFSLGYRDKTRGLTKMDGVIDMTASLKNIDHLYWYHDYHKYVCYRNGYQAIAGPRLPPNDRHYVVPSNANKIEFEKLGAVDVKVINYGIDDTFYCLGDSPEFWNVFGTSLNKKEYWYFGHRPTLHKGGPRMIQLAEKFPNEVFVVSAHTPIPEHQISMVDLMVEAKRKNLTNLRFITTPENPRYHYFKRELIRNAKGCLSPFDSSVYMEGFGLLSAEAVSCGTPLLITDSASSRELWINRKDGIIVPNDIGAFAWAIENWSTFSFEPTNKFSLRKYGEEYVELLKKYVGVNNAQAIPSTATN